MTLPTRRLTGLLAGLLAATTTAACLAPDAVPGDDTGGTGGSTGTSTTGGGATGGTLLWARSYGNDTVDNARARSLATTPDDAVLVAGDFSGSLTIGSLPTMQNSTGRDAFVAQLDASGHPAWSIAFAGLGDQLVYQAVAAPDGGVVIAGSFTQELAFAGQDMGNEPQGSDGFVASLDDEQVLRWLVRIDGSGDQAVHALAVTPTGDVVIAGTFDDTLHVATTTIEGDLDGSDFFVARLGSTGKPLWATSLGATPASFAAGEPTCFLAVGGDSGIHVAGTFAGTLRFGENLGAVGKHDVFVGKLDAAGVPLWGHAIGAEERDQRAAGLAVDALGNVVLAGDLRGKATMGGQMTLESDGDASDAFLASYDVDGELRWAARYGSKAQDHAGAVSVDAAGDILFAGQFRGAITFGDEPVLQNEGAQSPHDDLFLARLSPSGKERFSAAFGENQDQIATALTIDPSGHVLLSGYFGGLVDFGGGELDAKNGDDLFVAKWSD